MKRSQTSPSQIRVMTPEELMKIALCEAKKAFKKNEVPVGALLFFEDGKIIKDHNRKLEKGILHHAEMNVLKKALKEKKFLNDAIMYVTLEPCIMCLGAMVESRIKGLVYSLEEPKFGGISLLVELWKNKRYPHRFFIHKGLFKEESEKLLKEFFRKLRIRK